MSDLSASSLPATWFLKASRNIQIAVISGLILRIFLLVTLNYHRHDDINLHHYVDLFNIYSGITLCAIFVLFIGIFKENHYFLIPYVSISIVEIPLTSIALIFDLVILLHSVTTVTFLEWFIGLIIILWNFFATWLLLNNYHQIEIHHKLKIQIETLNSIQLPDDDTMEV